MKKLLIAILATVMTQQAMAVNWLLVSESIDDYIVYIDLDSIQADTLVNGTPVMTAWTQVEFKQAEVTSAVNNGEKHLVDFIRQPDGKSLGILGQVT